MAHSSYLKLNWNTIKWLILAGMLPPLFFHISGFVQHQIYKIDSLSNFFFWTTLSVTLTVGLTIIVFQEIRWIDTFLPWKKSVVWRIVVELLVTNTTVLTGMFLFGHFSYEWHCDYYPNMNYQTHMFHELSTGFIVLTIIISIIEGSYFFREWKHGLLLTEQLKKESLQAQLESLKNQVNPHFLFNSLNVLSNLVHKDADRAEEFIDQFASVYRYVLNIQDKTTVTLGEELDFINSYTFLQKIRFQDGFNLEIEIQEECYDHHIVPLSIQMMVENAIKHNVVSEEEPLLVKIHLDCDMVHVENKINLRTDENKSVGMGLNNLRQRYFLLAGIMPEIKKENGYFYANIPLIKPEIKEETNDEAKCCNHRRRKICFGKA